MELEREDVLSSQPRGHSRVPCGVGVGVGAGFALGAKLVRPEAETWIVYGDGSVGEACAHGLTAVANAAVEGEERVLVFSQYVEMCHLLRRRFAEEGIDAEVLHGGLSADARDRLVDRFQAGDIPVLVISLKAGGTGLNLTAANHVVLYDRWWNPAVEDQARDRAWRLGQTRTVIYHQLICPGTIDSRVEEVVAGKRKIADVALPKSSSVEDLDPEQLRRALGLRMEELLDEVDGDGGADDEEDAA